MDDERFQFNRGAIRPLECLVGGWRLIKEDYWFFLGVAFVGILVAEMGPFGILAGPAMCGVHICLLRQMNGQRVKFDMLFQGFNYFGPSLVATLFMVVPMMVVVTIYLVGYFGGVFGLIFMAEQQQQAGQRPDDMFGLYLIGWIVIWTLAFIFFAGLVQLFFFFSYPLIVDRELSGSEAVRLSFRAVWGNLGGVLMIVLLEMLLGLFGVLCCYIGAIFVLPINFAMSAEAYRQVFPTIDPFADMKGEIEPPPSPIVVDRNPHVQSLEPRSSGYHEKRADGTPTEDRRANDQ